MLISRDSALQVLADKLRKQGAQPSSDDLHDALVDGAVGRVWPQMMAMVANRSGLLPISASAGTLSEAMHRLAAPMVGGMVCSTVLTLIAIPAAYGPFKGPSALLAGRGAARFDLCVAHTSTGGGRKLVWSWPKYGNYCTP